MERRRHCASTDELAEVEATVTIADASGQMDGDGVTMGIGR
jgi:hypothetical protein